MELKIAQRQKAKIKLALQGASGTGKTFSALSLAYGLVGNWNKIMVIDCEANSSHLYSHLGNYLVLNLTKPFSPERYIEAIEICEKAGAEAIIVDSLSHEWSGEGGILDIHQSMPGNSFTNWAKVSPRHNALIQRILQSNTHIIATLRTKQDYVLQDKGGRFVVEKVGLAAVQREDVSYEFTIQLDLDIKHYATASKDRTNLFSDKPPFVITVDTGKKISDWCNLGRSLESAKAELKEAKDVSVLREILKKYPEYRSELEPLALNAKRALETVECLNMK